MSKILRRPMFRGGGKVSSYGNGIATGLADGGRVGLKYGGPPTYDRFQGFNSQQPVTQSDFLNFLNTQGGSQVGPVLTGGEISDKAMERFKSKRFFDSQIEVDDEFERDENDNKVYKEDQLDFDILDYKDTVTGGLGSIAKDNKTLANLLSDQIKNDNPPYISPTMEMKQNEMNEGLPIPDGVVKNPGEVPVITGGGEDEGIQAMADNYFKLMGGDKARGQDIADMLLRFSGSEGDTVGEKFKNYTKEEAKVKSRTEGLKEKASGFAIQQDAQMKLLQKKLDSAESIADKNLIAAEMRALNKQYSPPVTQKDINYGKSLTKGSPDHTLYLREKKLAPTLESEIKSKVQMGTAMGIGEINALGPIYYDNWQGIFKEGISEDDGRYLDVANQEIVFFQGGKEISKTKITLTQ